MDFSRTGTLLTAPSDAGSGNFMLSWVDRVGRGEPLNIARLPYLSLAISPDGAHVALTISNSIAVLDLDRLTLRKLTLPARAENPVWSGDGRRVYFGLEKGPHYEVFSKAADDSGAAQLAFASDVTEDPIHVFAGDARFLTTRVGSDGQKELIFRETGPGLPGRPPKLLFRSLYLDQDAAVSPSTRWVAYQSNATGRDEIYVQSFPDPAITRRVTADGGGQVRWRRDGKELFYLGFDDKLMSVPVSLDTRGQKIDIGTPTALFLAPMPSRWRTTPRPPAAHAIAAWW